MTNTRPVAVPDGEDAHRFVWEALEPVEPVAEGSLVVRAVMVSSIDGTISVGGRSAPLGTDADQLVYHGMRARADVVVAGARTALLEDYGPTEILEGFAALRGGRTAPPLLLVTRELGESVVDHCLRRGPENMVVACGDVPDTGLLERCGEAGLAVHRLGRGPLGTSLRALLSELGAGEVALEGGPRLLGHLVSQDAVDEIVLSVSPTLRVGAEPRGIVSGDTGHVAGMHVTTAFTCGDGGLYTVWARPGRSG